VEDGFLEDLLPLPDPDFDSEFDPEIDPEFDPERVELPLRPRLVESADVEDALVPDVCDGAVEVGPPPLVLEGPFDAVSVRSCRRTRGPSSFESSHDDVVASDTNARSKQRIMACRDRILRRCECTLRRIARISMNNEETAPRARMAGNRVHRT